MAILMGNAGSAEAMRKAVAQAVYSGDTLFLVLDQARTVKIFRTKMLDKDLSKELKVKCEDIDDGTTVILYLPYVADSLARALVIRPNKEGA